MAYLTNIVAYVQEMLAAGTIGSYVALGIVGVVALSALIAALNAKNVKWTANNGMLYADVEAEGL